MRYDSDRTPAETCSRIKDLGYGIAGHINLYGQRFQIVSDPFPDGEGISVDVITANDPTRRALRLPVSILIGLKDLFPRVDTMAPVSKGRQRRHTRRLAVVFSPDAEVTNA